MKFTLKSDYALNIIAIDKPPKYELKDTSCSTEKSSLLQVYCVRHQLFQCNFGIFIANEAAEENLKKKRDGSNKYLYELDFSSALKTARKFFMRRDSGRHIDIIRLMMKYVHAVKDRFRQFQRPLRDLLCQAPLFFINLNSTSTKFIFFT
ncbi:MAG: hypothetical protein ACLTMX_09480 [Roseburia faecis]|uniref:hypothetical protein n=2 Tax=Roseburia faecis TaxID=301302 RepID=UPI001FA71896|nr:hypothetical protein [Roseburia faecis]